MKAFLKYKNLHKPYKGGIGSFVLINMIVAYLQYEAKLVHHQSSSTPHHLQQQIPRYYLHEHLLKFLDFFAVKLNLKHVGISIRAGGFFFNKDMLGAGDQAKLCIQSPLNCYDDVSSAVFKFAMVIKKLFKKANDVARFNLLKSNSFVLLIVPEADKFKEEKSVND
jgi:non-canonical poly(A) RNA polymerase PAPD5/7